MANRYWVGGTGTWDTTSTTNWSTSSGGTGGASVPTSADSVFFDQASTYTVTMTGALTCLDITVSAGTVTFATGTSPTLTVSGNWATTSNTIWNSTGSITFNATTAKTIDSNGITINASISLDGTAGSWTLLSNLSPSNTTLTRGTLILGTYTLSCKIFSSSNSNTRSINFSTGKIVLNGNSTTTIWNTGTITNLTVSGTPLVESQGAGTGVTKTINTGTLSESNAISFSLLETTGSVTYTFSANNVVKNLIINGSQTLSSVALTLYGSFTHLTTNGTTTFSSGSNNWTFDASSGSHTITVDSGYTYNFGDWLFGATPGTTATWTLVNNLALGATKDLYLQNGLFDFNNKTFTGRRLVFAAGTPNVACTGGTTINIIGYVTQLPSITLPCNITATGKWDFDTQILINRTLDLNNFTLTTSMFTAFSSYCTLKFNGGTLAITGSGASAFLNNGSTGFTTIAGTGTGKISMTSASSKTFAGGGATYNCTLSNDGTGPLTITGNNTITTLKNGVQPTTITFTAGTTTTVTNWDVSGTAGNLVTINSDIASQHTLSKSSGTVNANYLNISRSTATGGATWYAGANSTDGGNNIGWIFSSSPPGTNSNFFLCF